MFSNLIESGSHTKDLKRRGKFFIGALAFYGLLLAVVGVGSIYAYNTSLDEQNNYEVFKIIRFPTQQEKPEPATPRVASRPEANSGGGKPQIAQVREVAVLTFRTDLPPAREDTPILARHMPYKIGGENIVPMPGGGGIGDGPVGPVGLKDGTGVVVVTDTGETAPPPVKVTPTPEPRQQHTGPLRLPSAIIAGKATYKPAPPYPIIAKQIKQQGSVAVQIVVDEQGRVISAKATSGPPLLLHAAEQAASQARFSPTTLNGQPVKISGVITYNFVLQ